MNFVDISIVTIILSSSLFGIWRGFMREILSLASWVIAFWSAYTYAPVAADHLIIYIEHPPVRVAAAFCTIFVVILVSVSVLGHFLGRLFSLSAIHGVDRSLGMLFGIVRGVFIVTILFLAATFMEWTAQPWWEHSVLVDYFTLVADMLHSLLTPDLADYFQSNLEPPG